MRKDDKAAVKVFLKANQEYSKLRKRRKDVFCLLQCNYRLTCIYQELINYSTEEEELQKLLDKVDERFKETEFSKELKRRTAENRYQLEEHKDTILKLMQHRTATETDSSKTV